MQVNLLLNLNQMTMTHFKFLPFLLLLLVMCSCNTSTHLQFVSAHDLHKPSIGYNLSSTPEHINKIIPTTNVISASEFIRHTPNAHFTLSINNDNFKSDTKYRKLLCVAPTQHRTAAHYITWGFLITATTLFLFSLSPYSWLILPVFGIVLFGFITFCRGMYFMINNISNHFSYNG